MSSIIGHEKIVEFLGKSTENNRLAHAYLFVGPEHIGKNTVAKWFAEKILKSKIENHPDFIELAREYDEKSDKLRKNISVEQIRHLNARLGMSSFLNSYKIAIIPKAEAISDEGANSLLKTLEEPKGKTIIILCAESTENILPTIVSRCQILNFFRVKKEKIYKALEQKGVGQEKARAISAFSLGRPGIALNLLKDEEKFEKYKTEIEKCCGLVENSLSDRFLKLEEYFKDKASLQEKAEQLKDVLWAWSSLFRDVLYIKEGELANVSNYFAITRLKEISNNFPVRKTAEILKSIEKTREYLQNNVNPRLALENLILRF